jgi:hypothetical protein
MVEARLTNSAGPRTPFGLSLSKPSPALDGRKGLRQAQAERDVVAAAILL